MIVGTGSLLSELIDLTVQLGIRDDVIFVGAIPHAEVHEFYLQSDLFLSTYRISNLGNPVQEAVAACVPIVTIGNGDTRSFINDDIGLLLDESDFENGNYDKLANIVARMFNSSFQLVKMREKQLDFRAEILNWRDRRLSAWRFLQKRGIV